MKKIKDLESVLNLYFQNPTLLKQALTHRSFLNEINLPSPRPKRKSLEANERLEFLGDAVLDFIVSEWLFEKFPLLPEGDLTNLRAGLVKTENLAEIAKSFQLGQYLILGKGEVSEEGTTNPNLLANSLEAIIGASFLDQGLMMTKKFIKDHFIDSLNRLLQSGQLKDYKSLFQEKTQSQAKKAPLYKIIKEEGPDHNKTFTVGAFYQKKLIATGQGKTKQAAQQEAAKFALEKIGFRS